MAQQKFTFAKYGDKRGWGEAASDKLYELGFNSAGGWSWYRMRDNDQTIYKDEAGNLYRAYDYRNGAINKFYNVKTGALIDGPGLLPSLEIVYKGETDTSNLGSNKGIFDNKMNVYEELTGAMKRISDNIFNVIDYFDALHKRYNDLII